MRKSVLTISVLGAMIFAMAVSAAAPANFAGTWTLDKDKSKGLDQRMQNAESVQWVITQDDKQISIESKVTGGQNTGGGPGGGGGGGMRGGGMGGPRTYNLDGKETTTEAKRRHVEHESHLVQRRPNAGVVVGSHRQPRRQRIQGHHERQASAFRRRQSADSQAHGREPAWACGRHAGIQQINEVSFRKRTCPPAAPGHKCPI